jgi:flagellar capping protein FliD
VQPGEIIALASVIFTVFAFIFGMVVRSYTSRIADIQKTNEQLGTKIDVLKQTLDAKQETIDEQHRQLDRLIITAEIQERFFSKLPRHISPSGPRES